MSKGKLAAAPQLLFVVNNRSDFLSILIQIFFMIIWVTCLKFFYCNTSFIVGFVFKGKYICGGRARWPVLEWQRQM